MANSTKSMIFLCIVFCASVSSAPQNSDSPPPEGQGPDDAVQCPETNGQFKHPQYCDQFINCWEGAGVVGNCEHGLYFNPTTSSCDYPSNVDCEGKEDSRPQMDQSMCPGGYGTFDNADHCGQFIVCHAGSVYVFNCPDGLVYNSTLGVCTYPEPEDTCLEKHQQATDAPPTAPSEMPESPQQPGEIPPGSRIPNFDFTKALPVSPSGSGSDANLVLFPVIPSWPKVNSYSLLKCPEGHRMGFVPATPTYAVCVKNDTLKF